MLLEITADMKNLIKTKYLETYSVTDVMRSLPGVCRGRIVKVLEEIGVYEGISGVNQQKHKQEKIKRTMLNRYGVINNGQRDGQGFKKLNKVPYKKISYLSEEFQKYKTEVERLTWKIASKLEKPDRCFYTGVKFIDAEQKEVNPNDPRKRTVDHKVPVLVGYLTGMSVEEVADANNLSFVLRYVNSAKGNTLHENFLPIAEKIKQVFKNEGY